MRKMRRGRRATVAVVALTATALFVTVAPSQADVGHGGKAKGEPIKVMTIGTVGTAEGATTSIEQVALAAEGWYNNNGGVGPDGRPLDVIFCNDQDTPEGGRECANQAIAEEVVAVVGGYSIQGAFRIFPLLAENNIPWVGGGALGPLWETADMLYPFAGGGVTTWPANGVQAGKKGCTKAGAMHWPSSTGDDATAYFALGLGTEGGELVNEGIVGFDATDLAPAVAAATSGGVDCLMFGMSPEQGALTVQSAQELGFEGTLVFYPDAVPPSVVEQTGGKDSPAQNGVTSSWFPVASDPVWNTAKKAVKKYSPDPSAVRFTDSFNAQIPWVAFVGLDAVLDTLDSTEGLTGADLITVLDSGDEFDLGRFLGAPIQFADHIPVLLPDGTEVTRVFNPYVVNLTIKNSKYRCVKPCKFIDMTDLMLSYKP